MPLRIVDMMEARGWSGHPLEVVAPLVFLTSLLIGTVFYGLVNRWTWDMSFYFAAQTLLGNMYGVPIEPTSLSVMFTLFYFVWGTTMLAAAISGLANQILIRTVRSISEERSKALDYLTSRKNNQIASSSSILPDYESSAMFLTQTLFHIGYFEHKSRLIPFTMHTSRCGVSTISYGRRRLLTRRSEVLFLNLLLNLLHVR